MAQIAQIAKKAQNMACKKAAHALSHSSHHACPSDEQLTAELQSKETRIEN